MPQNKTKSHLSSSPLANFLSVSRKYASFIGHRWWWLLIPLAIGILLAFWKNSKEAPVFVSHGRMMVNGKINLPEGAVYSEELSNFYGTQIELMQSAEIQRRAAIRVESAHPEFRAQAVSLAAVQQHGTSFFILTATSGEPQYCQAFLDAVMVEYIQFKREMRSESSDVAVTSVTDQLLHLDKELQAGEEELAAFQKKDNVVFLEEEGNSAGKYLISLKQKLADLQTEFQLLKLLDVDQNIARQHGEAPKADAGAAADAVIAEKADGPEMKYLGAKQQIELLQANMDRLGRFLRAEHPKMQQLADQISQQQRLIALYRDQTAAEIASRRAALGLQMQNLEGEIKEWEAKALSLNQRIGDYNRLKSRVERTKTLTDRLLGTVQNVDVNKSLGQDVVTIMEHASPPNASRPGLVKDVATGGATGLACGLGILILLAMLDDRVSSVLEAQQVFDEEILAQFPREPWVGKMDLANMETKHPMFAEAARNLRSSLLFMSFEGARPKTILVTSSVPDEGKSTISANLAVALATTGAKTLLIDGDLRKGALHELFGRSSAPGLSEVLRREVNAREIVTATHLEHLSFLPRGSVATDASELYLREVTDEFLRQVYQEFDYIIFDSAPVLAKEDSASLAPKIDATLFVVRAGVTSFRRTKSALHTLHQRSVNVLGLVFNSASQTSPGYYYYQSYGPEASAAPPPAAPQPK
jgi:polysaccharide biosynthesis transport protein